METTVTTSSDDKAATYTVKEQTLMQKTIVEIDFINAQIEVKEKEIEMKRAELAVLRDSLKKCKKALKALES